MPDSTDDRNVDAEELRRNGPRQLADLLKACHALNEPRLEHAFIGVPRHLFLPGHAIEEVYQNQVILTKESEGLATSSCSQPSVVATLLGLLDPQPGGNLLEIGAGTGWAAALMGRLVAPAGRVTTIDISEEVAAEARDNLASAGLTNVEVIAGDGGRGYAPNAPYDGIIATVGIWDVTPEWLAQLKVGGRLVVPLWLNNLQFGALFEKTDESNCLVLRGNSGYLGFMRLRGAFAGRESFYHDDDYRIESEITDEATRRKLVALLKQEATLSGLPHLQKRRDRARFCEYLALVNRPVVGILDGKKRSGFSYGVGLFLEDSLAVIPQDSDREDEQIQLAVFGSSEAQRQLDTLYLAWDRLGRPGLDQAHIVARPLGRGAAGTTLRKRWMEYEVSFPAQGIR